jgi:hypothetical protein
VLGPATASNLDRSKHLKLFDSWWEQSSFGWMKSEDVEEFGFRRWWWRDGRKETSEARGCCLARQQR